MRILYLVHQFFPEYGSGTEVVTLGICRTLQLSGNSVTVLTCSFSQSPGENITQLSHRTYLGIPIYCIPRSELPANADISLESYDYDSKLDSFIEQGQFDICHVMHPMRMSRVIDLVAKYNIPYIVTLTDFFFDCYLVNRINLQNEYCPSSEGGKKCFETCRGNWTRKELIERHVRSERLLSLAVFRACPSYFVKATFDRAYPDLEFHVIPHGIHFSDIHSYSRPDKTEKDVVKLGFVGSIIPIKGLHILLDALKTIDGQRIKLVIAGKIPNESKYSQKIRRDLEGNKRVEYLGEIDHGQVLDLIRKVDLLCIPSLVPEAASLVFSESMAVGTPVLGSDLGFVKDSIDESGAGLLAKCGDVDSWTKAINDILDEPDKLPTMSDNTTLPLRVEEEAFYYQAMYKDILSSIE